MTTETWYSPRYKELLGFRDDEFPNIRSSWESRIHPDDRPRVVQALVDHSEHKKPYDIEYRVRTKSGEYRWFSSRGQAVWDEHGKMVRMAGSLRDITQTREYAAKLEQSEAKWRSLVENAPDVILLVDPQGTIQFINRTTPGFESTIGRTMYDYIDKEFWDVAHGAMEEVCTTGAPQYFEALVHRPDGGTAWYATRSGAIWHNGRVESVVRIATDITHRKIADEELKRERHLLRRLLDLQERERQIVAYDIHDGLVQYLTGGLMHLEAFAAARGRPVKTSQDEYERGMGLLRNALAEARRLISGLRPPILDEQGIVAALEYLINESRADIKEIQFVNRTHFGRLAAPLEAAIFRITQEALTNIRRHSHSRKARLELLQHGDWIRLVVRDWGCGFEPGRVQEERFGLQGIRQRARLLGTIATIESAPGEGTAIVVDFPIISEHQPESFSAGWRTLAHNRWGCDWEFKIARVIRQRRVIIVEIEIERGIVVDAGTLCPLDFGRLHWKLLEESIRRQRGWDVENICFGCGAKIRTVSTASSGGCRPRTATPPRSAPMRTSG